MNHSVNNNISFFSNETNVIYFAANVINLTLGLPTNIYVLWLILTEPQGAIASDFFALNLAMSDILSSQCNLLFIISSYQGSADVNNAAKFFKGIILYGRSPFQCCICVERYLAVVHPVTFLKYKPLRYRVGCCGVVWLLVIGTCFGYIFSISTLTWNYFALSFNLVMFSVMLFCCLAVLRALKRSGPGDGDREREGTNNMKRRAFWIIFTIMVFSGAMYIPRVLLLLSFHLINISKYNFALSVSFLNTVIFGFFQPLLYLHKAGKMPCVR